MAQAVRMGLVCCGGRSSVCWLLRLTRRARVVKGPQVDMDRVGDSASGDGTCGDAVTVQLHIVTGVLDWTILRNPESECILG